MTHFSITRSRCCRTCSCDSREAAAAATAAATHKQSKRQLTPPRRWLEQVLRGGRLAAGQDSFIGSGQQKQQDRCYSLLDEYHRLYKLAEEELSYATETQGSIYYAGDLAAAKKALEQWLDCYEALIPVIVDPCELTALIKGYERARQMFYDKLKHLPVP